MRRLVIVGAGPAGFYAAEAALAHEQVEVELVDRWPTPHGLVRSGVAPDHGSIKGVSRRFEAALDSPRLTFLGGVEVGRELTLAELLAHADDVLLAIGAPDDRTLGIEGEDLAGVYGSAAFVGWYNAHPPFEALDPALDRAEAVVIGQGNVAVDCARILLKPVDALAATDIAAHALARLQRSAVRSVAMAGRRGPLEASFTLKEVGELGELSGVDLLLDAAALPRAGSVAALEPARRRVMERLATMAGRPATDAPRRLELMFHARPLAFLGDGRVQAVRFARTLVDEAGRARDTGETFERPAGLVITAIGYRTPPLETVAFDEAGRVANRGGRVAERLWCTGWARRGPSGTIGTNRTDAQEVVAAILARPAAAGTPADTLAGLLAQRGARWWTKHDWRRLDAREVARARPGAPRDKFAALAAMEAARGEWAGEEAALLDAATRAAYPARRSGE